MLVIWRRHGWLVLVFFLFAWALSTGLVGSAYSKAIGEAYLSNPQKAVTWGISLVIMAALMFVINLLLLRNEGKQMSDAEWQAFKAHQLANYRYIPLKDDAPNAAEQHRAQFEASLRAASVPSPTKSSHFFFIPMKFMPIVFAAIGVLLLALNFSQAQKGS